MTLIMASIYPRLACRSSFLGERIRRDLGSGLRFMTRTHRSSNPNPIIRVRNFSSISLRLRGGYSGTAIAAKFPTLNSGIQRILIRNSSGPMSFKADKTLSRHRMNDQIPKIYELIYRSTFGNYLISIQVLHLLMLGSILTVIGIKAMDIWFPATEEEIQERIAWSKENQVIPVLESEENMLTRLRNPHFNQIVEGGLPVLGFFILALLIATASLNRFQRCLPVRIYTSPKGHSIAIMYGHLIPLRTTRYEFMAGNLKLMSNPRGTFRAMATYKDTATKKDLILMEHFFRYPADLNRLLGIPTELGKSFDQGEREPNAPYPDLPDDPSLPPPSKGPDGKPRKFK